MKSGEVWKFSDFNKDLKTFVCSFLGWDVLWFLKIKKWWHLKIGGGFEVYGFMIIGLKTFDFDDSKVVLDFKNFRHLEILGG